MTAFKRIAAIALWLGVLAVPAAAQDGLAKGPRIGAPIPVIAAVDHHGAARDFQSLKGKQGLILIFSRSLRW